MADFDVEPLDDLLEANSPLKKPAIALDRILDRAILLLVLIFRDGE